MTSTARQTYSMVVSTLALVIALGGSGVYAAQQLGKNSVTSKQIKNGTVQAKDLRSATLTGAQVADGSLRGQDLAGDSLTGAKVDESSLGKVPAAAAVDTVQSVNVTLQPTQQKVVLLTRGPLAVKAECSGPAGVLTVKLYVSTSTDNASWALGGSGDLDLDAADGDVTVLTASSPPYIASGDLYLGAADGTAFDVLVSVRDKTVTCGFHATVVG